MSERTFFLRRPSQSLALMFMFICAALLLLPAAVHAQTSPYVDIGGRASYSGGFATFMVDLYQDQGASPIIVSGFSILIGYNPQVLTLVDVVKGQTLTNCGWEYFTYRTSINSGCTDSCPSGLIRVVAIADINNGNSHPTCYNYYGLSLAYLTFQVAASADLMSFSPISFYWKDCGDNVLASVAGDSLFLAKSVYGLYDTLPLPTPSTLPSLNGTPESCASMPGKTAVRRVNYQSGSIRIIPPPDTHGDLNLNNLPNEIADLVVFWNYYYLGMSAFNPIYWRQQVAQTDINGDGVTLTFRDLVFLYRIIVGDTLPVPKNIPTSANATFIQDTATATVTVSSNGMLAGALLHFAGLIEPTLNWPVEHGWAGFWPDTARNMTIGIWLGPSRGCCSNSQMLTYTGKGKLIQAEAADWFDSEVKTKIVVTGGTPIYGDVDGSGRINIADVIYLIGYIFQGGANPIDPYHGDMDCDGSHDLGDAIYLLNYIFAGGPAPCGIVR